MTGYITKHIVANEARMMRTQHRGALLLVEGPSDKTAYLNLIDRASCRIVISHGKETAIGALKILEDSAFQGVLAILDSDFRMLEPLNAVSLNVAFTDGHDLECLMCRSPAFDKLLGEYASHDRLEEFEKQNGQRIVQLLGKRAMTLGYLRWASIRNGWSFDFEGLNFGNFVERQTLLVIRSKLFKEVGNRSQKHALSDADLEAGMDALVMDAHDPWHVSCGHDILELLSFALRSVFRAHRAVEVGREQLERSLRLAYETAYFAATMVFAEIRRWEARNAGYTILP